MLAALTETQQSSESLLLLLSKTSGAPLFPGYKMWHDESSKITSMKPLRNPMMLWTDATTLWIGFSLDYTTYFTAEAGYGAFIKLHVSLTEQTITLLEHTRQAGLITTTYLYTDIRGKTFLARGGTQNTRAGFINWKDIETSWSITISFSYSSIYTAICSTCTISSSDYQSLVFMSYANPGDVLFAITQ
jgi:hypothetical protein